MNKIFLGTIALFCLCQTGIAAPAGKPKVITREMAPEVFDFKRIEELTGLSGKTGKAGRQELFERLFGERVNDELLDRLESSNKGTQESARREYTDTFLKLVTAEGREGLLSLEGVETGDLPLVRKARGLQDGDISTPRAENKEFGKKLQVGAETAEAKFDTLAMATRLDPSGETAAGLREFYKNDPDGRSVRSVRDLMRTEEANRPGVAGEVEGTVQTGPGGTAVTRELPAERRAELRNVIELLTTDSVLRGHLTPSDVTSAGTNARIQAHDHALARESALSESPITWTGFATMSKLSKESLSQSLVNRLGKLGVSAKEIEGLSVKQLEAKLKAKVGESKYDSALKEVASDARRLIAQGVLARLIENARAIKGPDGKPSPLMTRRTLKSLLACAPAAIVLGIATSAVVLSGSPAQAGEKSDKKCSYDINDPDGVCFDEDIQNEAKAELARRANGEAGDPAADAGAAGENHPGSGGVAKPKKRPQAN